MEDMIYINRSGKAETLRHPKIDVSMSVVHKRNERVNILLIYRSKNMYIYEGKVMLIVRSTRANKYYSNQELDTFLIKIGFPMER